MDHKESDENKTPNPCATAKTMKLKDDVHLKKMYITWKNKSNTCWLNASMALVAHNSVMNKNCHRSPKSRISKIISEYWEAMSVLNNPEKNFEHRLNLARGKLTFIQSSALCYLQPIMKYMVCGPESAFCSLYNLLVQDSVIRGIFNITWQFHKECSDCKHYSLSFKRKPVITLSKIDNFNPENPVVLYHCPCNKSLQKIKLSYVGLPPCLIFHFESGAGNERPPLSFTTQGREYQLTSIMTLEKSQDSTVNHFITWIRDPSVNKWLECNDLNMDIISFSSNFPNIKYQDVYIYVYESSDDNGTIMNIPLIDLTQPDSENLSLKSAASTSGTSCVQLSVRKKKKSLSVKRSFNEINNPDSKESFSMSIYAPSCSKSTQETRVPKQEADDYVPISGVSKKKYARRISNVENGAKNTKEGASNSKANVRV